MQRVRGSLLVLVIAGAGIACTDDAAVPDAGTRGSTTNATGPAVDVPAVPELPPADGVPPGDPVAAVARFLPGVSGWCVQIRSVPTRLEADRIAAGIREQLELDVALIDKDLGDRGVWWRVCVGSEPTERAAEARAKVWTSPKGPLRPFMTEVAPGQAAYQVVERQGRPARAPTKAMALGLLRAKPGDERPPHMVSAHGHLFGAVTLPPDAVGTTDVAVIDESGAVLGYAAKTPAGCEACTNAISGARPARRLLGIGDVSAAAGEELLVEERGGDDDAVLSVFSVRGSTLERVAWFLLGTSTANLRVLGDARALDADGEPGEELALTRLELPLLGDRLCALHERVEVLDLRRVPARKLDASWANTMGVAEQSGGAQPTRRLVAALDHLGDPDAASRVCASYLRSGKDPTLASLCIARVSELQQRGRVVAAVNAAGLLSDASESLRAAVAGPFYRAASALAQDPRLEAGSGDCEAAPLVQSVQGKRLEHLVRLARLRVTERLALADLVPEVFITGARDFGPAAPVGQLTSAWMERLKVELPARHAALEGQLGAVMAPVKSTTSPTPAAGAIELPGSPTPDAPGAGKAASPEERSSGYIHIEVHDDEDPAEEGP